MKYIFLILAVYSSALLAKNWDQKVETSKGIEFINPRFNDQMRIVFNAENSPSLICEYLGNKLGGKYSSKILGNKCNGYKGSMRFKSIDLDIEKVAANEKSRVLNECRLSTNLKIGTPVRKITCKLDST